MANISTKGGRIRYAREEAKLSQSQLAATLAALVGRKIQKGSISQWETNNVVDFAHETLIALERVTGFSLYWIVTGKGPERVEKETKKGRALVETFVPHVDVDVLANCVEIAQSLAGSQRTATDVARVIAKLYSLDRDVPSFTEANLRKVAQLLLED
ncbi:MAG: helix-turn-helix domain-containing protein [Planctomycetales bacterium]|nr:helix-turn-helix domain-containing protein [Planctomycetales bacterium]